MPSTTDNYLSERLFNAVLNADSNVVCIQTPRAEQVLDNFRLRVRQTGESAYLWRRGDGLISLREGGMRIPGCERPIDAFRHVQRSRHFGVYLMLGMPTPLSASQLSLVRSLARARGDVVRRIVLLGEDEKIAESVGDLATHLQDEVRKPSRWRLRDGRWVQ